MRTHERRVKTLPSEGQSPSRLQRLYFKLRAKLCFPVLLLREPCQGREAPTLDNELEALLVTPGSPLISFCLLVPWDFSHHHKKESKKRKKALISAALTTRLFHLHYSQLLPGTITLEKLQLPSHYLLLLAYLERSLVFPIKWGLALQSSAQLSTARSLPWLIPLPMIFFPFCILWPHSPWHAELPKGLKEILCLTVPGNQQLMAFSNINQMFSNFVPISIYVSDIKQIMDEKTASYGNM